MSKLEDKLTASIKPNQRKASTPKASPRTKPETTEAETPLTSKPEQAEQVAPKAAPKSESTGGDMYYMLPAKRVWPD